MDLQSWLDSLPQPSVGCDAGHNPNDSPYKGNREQPIEDPPHPPPCQRHKHPFPTPPTDAHRTRCDARHNMTDGSDSSDRRSRKRPRRSSSSKRSASAASSQNPTKLLHHAELQKDGFRTAIFPPKTASLTIRVFRLRLPAEHSCRRRDGTVCRDLRPRLPQLIIRTAPPYSILGINVVFALPTSLRMPGGCSPFHVDITASRDP